MAITYKANIKPAPNNAPNTAPLGPDLFERLFAGLRPDRYEAGRHLFLQDDRADAIYGLVDGSVEIAIFSIDGQKLVANVQVAPGLIGEIGALDGGLRSATTICRTPCLIYRLSRERLLQLLADDAALMRDIIKILCSRIRWATTSLGDQAFMTVDGRLAKRLLLLSELIADAEGWIAVSQVELAELLGVTRESVNKLINLWRDKDVLATRRGRVRIVNPTKLRTFAQ